MQRFIACVVVVVATLGCGPKYQITPEQTATAGACIAQLQLVAASARGQVSSCVDLVQSLKTLPK